jgi:putative ABC transport system permease protein
MPLLVKVRSALRNLFSFRHVEVDLDQEVRAHIEMLVDENIQAGMPAAEALRAAKIELGGIDQVKEQVREKRIGNWLHSVISDYRYALRQFRRSPGFTVVAVLTLALGIGANTAIFSLIDAVMLRMLPVRHPEELVLVADLHTEPNGFQPLPDALWKSFRDRQNLFSGTFAWASREFDLAQGGEAQNVDGLFVSGDYFGTLGLRPAAGRLFTTNDDFAGCPGTAVLRYGFWQSHYGGDPSAVGNAITLDGHGFQVVGVSAPGFYGVETGHKFDVAIPACAETILGGDPAAFYVRIMGRLKSGWSAEQADARLATLSPSIITGAALPEDWKQDPAFPKRLATLPSATGLSAVRSQYKRPLQILMTVVGLVLLIACANIACLLLARATARRKEIAVRLAMGASRRRLIRQLLTEAALLSLAGAVLGLFLAHWGSILLIRLISTPTASGWLRVSLNLALDWRVLGFTACAAVLASIFFGTLPSVVSTRVSPISAMKGSGAEEAEHRGRFRPAGWVVAMQVALSLVLLFVAGLFLQSFRKLATLDTGFDRKNVLLVNVNMHNANVPEAQRSVMCSQILERLIALPGVQSASQSFLTPIMGRVLVKFIDPRGPNAPTGPDAMVYVNYVSPGFPATSGTPLLSGREFTDSDSANAQPVAMINPTMARKFFPGDNPVGKSFTTEFPGEPPRKFLVIGVLRDAKVASIREDFHATAYFSAAQIAAFPESWNFEMRTGLRPSAVERATVDAVGSVNKAISLQFSTIEEQVDASIRQERLLAVLSSFFGGLAVLLSMIGLYGVLSYSVAQRMPEIGVRIALGAEQWDVLRMVIGHGFRLTLIGVALGAAAALILGRLLSSLSSLLFGVRPSDPPTLTAVSVVTIGVAILACYIPARRATKVDPMVALRYE